MNKVETAVMAESLLHDSDHGWEKKNSFMFTIVKHDGKDSLKEISRHNDVYEMLESNKAVNALADNRQVLIVTCGWAAPVGDDEPETPPSIHPQRRRVRLCIFVGETGVASVLRFSDEPEEIITDDGKAQGELTDAIWTLRQLALKGEK